MRRAIFSPPEAFDASSAFISPTWFEDFGVPETPRHVNPASLASSVEETFRLGATRRRLGSILLTTYS